MVEMDRVTGAIQSIFEHFYDVAEKILPPDDLAQIKTGYYKRVTALNPMMKAIIELKDNKFSLHPMEEKDLRNHLKEIVAFIKDYYLELRRNILGLPAVDIRELTTVFQEQLEEIDFYDLWDE